MKRLVIVADHSFVVHAIRLALRQTAGFQVVGFIDALRRYGLVRGVILASTSTGSRSNDWSTSARTGVAPANTIAEIEATNVNPGTITSSPEPTPRPSSAIHSAADPPTLSPSP